MNHFYSTIDKAYKFIKYNKYNFDDNDQIYIDTMYLYNSQIMEIRSIMVSNMTNGGHYYSMFMKSIFGGYCRDKLMYEMSTSKNTYAKLMCVRLFWKFINTGKHDIDIECNSRKVIEKDDFDELISNINIQLEQKGYPKLISTNDKLWEKTNSPQGCNYSMYNYICFIFKIDSPGNILHGIKFGIDFAEQSLVGCHNDFEINCLKINHHNNKLSNYYSLKPQSKVLFNDIKLQLIHNKIKMFPHIKRSIKRIQDLVMNRCIQVWGPEIIFTNYDNIYIPFHLKGMARYFKLKKYGFNIVEDCVLKLDDETKTVMDDKIIIPVIRVLKNTQNFNILKPIQNDYLTHNLQCIAIQDKINNCANCQKKICGKYYWYPQFSNSFENSYVCCRCGDVKIFKKKLLNISTDVLTDISIITY